MNVSIVIVSYNTCEILDECIVSIKRETRCEFECIVVDNNSRDRTIIMLQEKHPDVTLIQNHHNVGFARANNQGFSRARGKYFLMLNPDTVILDSAIDKLFAFMENHGDIGICSPKNIGRDGQLQLNCDHFPNFWNTFCVYSNFINRYPSCEFFCRSRMQYWDYSDTRDVEKVMGCSLMIASDLFNRLGGLDERFFMYFEETDLCYRVKNEKFRTVYLPSSVIIHYGGESAIKQDKHSVINRTISKYYFESQYLFYKKNYGTINMLAIRALDFLYGVGLFCRNLFRPDKQKQRHGLEKSKSYLAGTLGR